MNETGTTGSPILELVFSPTERCGIISDFSWTLYG